MMITVFNAEIFTNVAGKLTKRENFSSKSRLVIKKFMAILGMHKNISIVYHNIPSSDRKIEKNPGIFFNRENRETTGDII